MPNALVCALSAYFYLLIFLSRSWQRLLQNIGFHESKTETWNNYAYHCADRVESCARTFDEIICINMEYLFVHFRSRSHHCWCFFLHLMKFLVSFFYSQDLYAPQHYHYRCITDAKRHLWVPIIVFHIANFHPMRHTSERTRKHRKKERKTTRGRKKCINFSLHFKTNITTKPTNTKSATTMQILAVQPN